jgi:hypothetical protein
MGARSGRRWAREEIGRLRADRDHERIAHPSLEVRYGDPAERSWTDHYGSAYGASPQISAVGFRAEVVR